MTTVTTIYELPGSLSKRCQPLYAQAWFDKPVYDSVFEGRQPARLFVDDAENPSAALLCHAYDYHIAGRPDTPLRTFIREAPEEAGVFQTLYMYTTLNDEWTQALTADTPLTIIPRRNFQWEMDKPAPTMSVPVGARIERVTLENAERVDGALPLPFLKMFWGSYEALCENGMAYYAAQGDAVTSVIYAVSMSSTGVVIGIDTVESFQRQGYGAAVSAAFIREALARGLQPFWDTDETNERSMKLAQKLGFVEETPFKEFHPVGGKLTLSQDLWTRGATRDDGVIEWRRK